MQDDYAVLMKLLVDRYSCRSFLKQDVDAAILRDIVAAAGRSPSWCNAQPWQVIVTKGDETAKLSDALVKAASTSAMEPDFDWPLQYTGDYLERRKVCGYQLYASLGIERDDKVRRTEQMMENYRFFGAPHVAIVTSEGDLGPYGAADCGGFLAMFTIAAQAKGIASVPQASVTGYAPVIREQLGIPKERKILSAISFGYADPDHAANNFRTERADVDDILSVRGS